MELLRVDVLVLFYVDKDVEIIGVELFTGWVIWVSCNRTWSYRWEYKVLMRVILFAKVAI